MRNKTCLNYIIVALLGQLLIAGLIYYFGFARGRGNELSVRLTEEAALLSSLAATFTPSSTIGPTVTETGTPLPTGTPTITPIPSPSQTPTITASPASPQEWSQRFYDTALDGLNTIDSLDFSPVRAAVLLSNVAQNQGLISVPASYVELQGEPWAALMVPRTPDGQTFPTLFWRESGASNQILGQRLLNDLETSDEDKRSRLAGIDVKLWRTDVQGLTHLFLMEQSGATQALNAYLFIQPQPASQFDLIWHSQDAPLWSAQAGDSQYSLIETGERLLPDIEISAPMLSQDDGLREHLDAPAAFVEQSPFARQWSTTRWTPILASEQADGTIQSPSAVVGYRMTSARLHPTPLTALSLMLKHLQSGDVSAGSEYTTRFDLLQVAFDLGLGKPSEWVALYLDNDEQEQLGNVVTARIRFFDNRDRSRTYDALFEADQNRNYLVAALVPAPPYENADLITPIPDGESILLPTPTPKATQLTLPTPFPTVTPKPTETPIPTVTPLPTTPSTIPQILPSEQAPTTGRVAVDGPTRARLRSGPGTDFDSLDGVNNGTQVEVFGVTEARNWLLVRANEGRLGWIAADLVFFQQDVNTIIQILPLYRADGIPVIPPTVTPSIKLPAQRATPIISQPSSESIAPDAPQPANDELVMVLQGRMIPADPLEPMPALDINNREYQLDLSNATVEIWRGLFDIETSDAEASGIETTGWVAAPAELLWPDTQVYVEGQIESANPPLLKATTVRIVRPPDQNRAQLFTKPQLAAAASERSAIGFLGSREEAGVYLLDGEGTVRPLWTEEAEIAWVNDDDKAGLLLQTPDQPNSRQHFTWVRADGTGIAIFAQPFHNIHGVAGDAYGGIWWIETPQVVSDKALDIWQLWHYDPAGLRIIKRFQASGEFFSAPDRPAISSLVPQLLAATPQFEEDDSDQLLSVSMLVDTLDRRQQKLYTGIFRFAIGLEGGEATIIGGPQLLLESEIYRGPLQVSPDRTKLAYFIYDESHPSLTSGFIRPANTLRMLALTGQEIGEVKTLYQSENEFEFLAPNLAWQGNHRLLLARSRFTEGTVFGVDRFGLVQIQLPVVDQNSTDDAEVIISNYLLTEQSVLTDFAPCRDGTATLLIVENSSEEMTLVRWDNLRGPVPVLGLPPTLTRSYLCWQSP